jgi:glycosyltransferase involved in cell wall biosynthesis
MSCGVACIGTNIEGINNIIKHKENGFLCETDSESIRNAILTLYKDKDLMKKIAQNARQFILDNCSLKSITNKEYLFYQEILKK